MQEIKTLDEFQEKIKESEGRVLVDFWASWCGPCKAMIPTLEKVDEQTDTPFFKMSIEDVPEPTQELGVRSIPTFIVFEDGEEVDRHVGSLSEDQFLEFLTNTE